MTIFNAFLKVLNKYKVTVIIYTTILIFFAIFNMKTSDNSTMFVSSKPDIYIVNNDEEVGITKELITYLENNSNIISLKDKEEAIDDAIFYRDVNYVIYIPKNFRKDFLEGKNPQIDVKSTGDYQASLAKLMLEKYLNIANIYNQIGYSEEELINVINETLKTSTEVKITTSLDTDALGKATYYYNFSSYALMAGAIQVICLILSSFKERNIMKRTIISSIEYKDYNQKLMISNSLFSLVLWFIYVVISFFLIGDTMFSMHGILYIINSFIFTICTVSIAFLIGNVIIDKNAINGIVNCVALGSAFLCGAFVPQELLPTSVLGIAHILPTYWFITNNELIKKIEVFNFEALKPYIINLGVLALFIIVFIFITNYVSKNKQRIS